MREEELVQVWSPAGLKEQRLCPLFCTQGCDTPSKDLSLDSPGSGHCLPCSTISPCRRKARCVPGRWVPSTEGLLQRHPCLPLPLPRAETLQDAAVCCPGSGSGLGTHSRLSPSVQIHDSSGCSNSGQDQVGYGDSQELLGLGQTRFQGSKLYPLKKGKGDLNRHLAAQLF